MKYLPCFFFVPLLLLAISLSSCSGDNRDDLTIDIDQVEPARSGGLIEYRGAKSGLEPGFAYTCLSSDGNRLSMVTNLDHTDEELGTGGEFFTAGNFVAYQLEYSLGGPVPFVIGIVILAIESEEGIVSAQCEDCITEFIETESGIRGAFLGEFTYFSDIEEREISIGEISGDFEAGFLESDQIDCE